MKKLTLIAFLSATLVSAGISQAAAEAVKVRLAKQYGIGYLALSVMESQELLEKEAKKSGLDVETEWLRFTGGSGMNEALLSGNLDIAAGGAGPMLTLWSRTKSNYGFKGLGALGNMPIKLVTINPEIKALADFTSSDKIALPAVKTSIQAVTLQMAAKKEFGDDEAHKLDPFTVSMGHPDAQLAMMGGQSGITAHFSSPPFQDMELKEPNAHVVVDSYDVVGGPHTFNLVWASQDFVDGNPKIAQAFSNALSESIDFIKANPEEAADIWMSQEKSQMSKDEVLAIMESKDIEWTKEPTNILPFLHYMYEAGLVNDTAESMQDIFFPVALKAAAK